MMYRRTMIVAAAALGLVAAAGPKKPARTGEVIRTIPKFWRVDEMLGRRVPSRIAMHEDTGKAVTVISTMNRDLDLPYQVKTNKLRAGTPRVPFAPPLVAGEGPDPANHTIVKILNKYGVADVTFLAYPPEVKGGVQVAAGRDKARKTVIVTAPFTSTSTRTLRRFNRYGGFLGEVSPGVPPPFAIVTGDFLPAAGDELAVCSREARPDAKLEIYDLDGTLLATRDLPPGLVGRLRLSVKRKGKPDSLIVSSERAHVFYLWPLTARPVKFESNALAGKIGVCEDAFSDESVLFLENDPVVSNVIVADMPKRISKRLCVSQFENRFWVVTPPRNTTPRKGKGLHSSPNIELARMAEGTYVRFCKYEHMRMDARSPGYRNPPFGNPDVKAWTGGASAPDLSSDRVAMWEPCFTHRGFPQLLGKWIAARDPVSRLPMYMMVARTNAMDSYKEAVGSSFALTSYALNVPDLDHVYLDTLSAFLRNLAARLREHPELMPSMEPNHENEIPLKKSGTFGDYNPNMIKGFFRYLVSMYGADIRTINAALRTPFTTHFDAPRNMGRGNWDSYSMKNPFFREWRNYNRLVVNTRLAQGFRESLLAGFPPELIKAHQIPAIYFGGVMSFSKVKTRITPIDYVVSCGLGGGYTRYGVWYRNEHNFMQGSHSSGYDSVVLGEYQSLTRDYNHAAKQLEYMYDHGVQGVHVMNWNVDIFQKTQAHAVREIIRQNRPRPGGAGGVSDVKSFVDGQRRFNIAVLGTGSKHVGLIKSLRADGTWEGSVYVAPFKAHTDITVLKRIDNAALTAQSIDIGPINAFNGGSQVELTFKAGGAGVLEFQVCRGATVLPGLRQKLKISAETKQYRVIHRTQVPCDGITLRLVAASGSANIADFAAYRHTTRFANVYRGIFDGKRHRGGLTFDILHE